MKGETEKFGHIDTKDMLLFQGTSFLEHRQIKTSIKRFCCIKRASHMHGKSVFPQRHAWNVMLSTLRRDSLQSPA